MADSLHFKGKIAISNRASEVECLSCASTSGLVEPTGGVIVETKHFHLWLVPRYEWMYEFGNSVESLRPVLLHAKNNLNNEDNMKQVIAAITKIKEELNGVKTDLL